MAENKGELHTDAACARPRRRTLSPPRPPCAPPIAYRPLVSLARTGDLAEALVSSIFECAWVELGCRRERAAS